MSRRYFSIDEANAQVPELTRALLAALQLRARLKSLYKKLDDLGYAPEGEAFPIVVKRAPPEVTRDRGIFKAMVEALREQVSAVQALGCTLKDLETGLVDWWAREGDRDVLLCWRLGEPTVAHWHEPDAGFAGRRPLTELGPTAEG